MTGISGRNVSAHKNGLFFEVDVADSQALMQEFESSAGPRGPLTLLLLAHTLQRICETEAFAVISIKCAPTRRIARVCGWGLGTRGSTCFGS